MLKNIKLGKYELILVLITLATFTHTLYFDFFIFDDSYHLAEDPNIFEVQNWENFFTIWKRSLMPVIYNFWQLMILMFGHEHAYPHRLALIIFHAINGVLIFSIIKLILKSTLNENLIKDRSGLLEKAAFIGTFTFLVHPTQVESIVWISSMKGVFSTLFALLSLLTFVKRRSNNSDDFKSLILVCFFFMLSILSKPSSAPLPVIFILLDFFVFRFSIKEAITRNILYVFSVIPFGILFFIRTDPNSVIHITTLWQKVIITLHSNVFYIKKLIFPFKYTLDYGNSILNVLRDYATTGSILMLIVTFLLSLAAIFFISKLTIKNKFEYLPPLIFLTLINLFTGLFPFPFQNVSTTADRYMYFPLLGFALFISYSYLNINSKLIKNTLHCYLGLYLIATLAFSSLWRDQEAVLMSSYEVNPNSYMLNMGIGTLYQNRDKRDKAEVFFQKASFINPNNLEPHEKLLSIYARGDKNELGLKHIRFLKGRFKDIPLPLALFEVDFLAGLYKFDEASNLIKAYRQKFGGNGHIDFREKNLQEKKVEYDQLCKKQ